MLRNESNGSSKTTLTIQEQAALFWDFQAESTAATIAALSALAIGGDHVLGLMLPEKETYNAKDIDDAKVVAEKFGLKTQVCDITPALEGFYKSIPIFDPQG